MYKTKKEAVKAFRETIKGSKLTAVQRFARWREWLQTVVSIEVASNWGEVDPWYRPSGTTKTVEEPLALVHNMMPKGYIHLGTASVVDMSKHTKGD